MKLSEKMKEDISSVKESYEVASVDPTDHVFYSGYKKALKNTLEDVVRLEQQIEAMKCCENCKHNRPFYEDNYCKHYSCCSIVLGNPDKYTSKWEMKW